MALRLPVALPTALPDVDALLLRQVHGVARLDVPRLVELEHVRQRPVGAVVVRAVRVEGDQLEGLLLGDVLTPQLCPREEEALCWREAVDEPRRLLAALAARLEQRPVCELEAAQVRDVL